MPLFARSTLPLPEVASDLTVRTLALWLALVVRASVPALALTAPRLTRAELKVALPPVRRKLALGLTAPSTVKFPDLRRQLALLVALPERMRVPPATMVLPR